MLNHLRKCEHQPENVRTFAETEIQNRKNEAQPMGPPTIAIPIIQDGMASLLPVGVTPSPQQHGSTYLPLPFTNQQIVPSASTSSRGSVRGSSRATSPYPDSIYFGQTLSRSSSVAAYSMSHDPPSDWSTDRQNTFNARLGQLTASAGLPLSWIENPEFLLFCQEFVHPSANVPSRKVLTHRILPSIKREFRKKAQAAIKEGTKATIQADGWSAINEHHLNAFMMTVEQKVCDTTLSISYGTVLTTLKDSHLKGSRLIGRKQDCGKTPCTLGISYQRGGEGLGCKGFCGVY